MSRPPDRTQFAYEEAATGEADAPSQADEPADGRGDRRAPDPDGQQAQRGSPSRTRSTTASRRRSCSSAARGIPGPDMRDREAVAKALLEALRHFGVEAKLLGVVSGPHVSRYELQLAPGTKVAKVAQLRDDLAYALASTDIRILAPIPGKKAVGVEVPEPAPAPGAARRHLRRPAEGLLAARRLARQGRLRASRCGPTWRRCRTRWSPAPPGRASRAASTRCSARSCCTPRRTRPAWCWSTRSGSS